MIGSIKTIVIISVVAIIAGSFWYVSGLRADLERSEQNVRTLQDSMKEQTQLIDRMREDQKKIRESRNEIEQLIREQRQTIDDLRSRFNESADGSERDFGELALEKPGLVENIINRGSSDAARCMELASGSELTQEEIDEDFDSKCDFGSTP